MVLLRRPADAPELPEDELDVLQARHLAHRAKLRRDGLLVAFGPLGEQSDSVPSRHLHLVVRPGRGPAAERARSARPGGSTDLRRLRMVGRGRNPGLSAHRGCRRRAPRDARGVRPAPTGTEASQDRCRYQRIPPRYVAAKSAASQVCQTLEMDAALIVAGYDRLLASIGDRAADIGSRPVVTHWPHVGSSYQGLVIVGQAVFGWADDCQAVDLQIAANRSAMIDSIRSRVDKPEPLDWIGTHPRRNTPFWKMTRLVVEALEPDINREAREGQLPGDLMPGDERVVAVAQAHRSGSLGLRVMVRRRHAGCASSPSRRRRGSGGC